MVFIFYINRIVFLGKKAIYFEAYFSAVFTCDGRFFGISIE
jgi:hypothetical protein